MSNFIKYCKIFDVILTSFQQKEKIGELHLFSNLAITRWKIKIFSLVISISSNCNFTNNTKHKCTILTFLLNLQVKVVNHQICQLCQHHHHHQLVIFWANREMQCFEPLLAIIFKECDVHRKMYFTCQNRFQMLFLGRNSSLFPVC